MDLCEHAYYKREEKYMPYLYCHIDDKRCIYSKKCMKVERFIPLENEMWKECYKFIMNKRNNIPEGSYFVQTYRPNRIGKLILYVAMENSTKKIQSDFTELNQDYVYIDDDIVSLTPIEKKVDQSAYFSYEYSGFATEEIVENNEKIMDDNEIEKVEKKTSNNKKRGRKPKNE